MKKTKKIKHQVSSKSKDSETKSVLKKGKMSEAEKEAPLPDGTEMPLPNIKGLIEITPAQDFQNGKAFVAVPFQEFIMSKDKPELVTLPYVITSDRKKILCENEFLSALGYYARRHPFLSERWQEKDIEEFLKGGTAPSIKEIFQSIERQSKLYLDFADQAWHKFVPLWIIATYFHRQNRTTPYIHLQGNAESGKTKSLAFIAALAFNGELSVSNTPSYMIRVVHDNHATCCIDEAENLGKSKDEDAKTMLAMLNAGYKKGSFIGKSENNGKNWFPKRFEGYSPKVLAGISNIYHTLASRSVNIVMVRSINQEVVNRELNDDDQELLSIRNSLYRAMLTHYGALAESYSSIKDAELLGRSWEIWKPILALAKLVDEHLYQEMREFAIRSEATKHEVQTEGFTAPIMLKIIYDLLEQRGLERSFFTSNELYAELALADEDNFGWLNKEENRHTRGKWLGNELRRSGIITGRAEQKKIDGFNYKGYVIDKKLVVERLKSFGVNLEPMTEEAKSEVREEKTETLGI